MTTPLPTPASQVLIAAPGTGDGWWAGAPTAVHDPAGGLVVAWRERHGHDGFDVNVIARSGDGGATVTEVLRVDARHFGARWIERPALVPLAGGGWRLYVCLGREGTKMWDIAAVDAPALEALGDGPAIPTLAYDDLTAVKDPIVTRDGDRWRAWVCCHLLDIPGAEDRMRTAHAVSADGLRWEYEGIVLEGAPGSWDQRGARLTALLPDGTAAYDGRATADENWFERLGIATPDAAGRFAPAPAPVADIRYLTSLDVAGGTRIWWEQRTPDGSHELRTELLPG